jgi:Spy/CpxP family protein refolding chaperone
MITKHWKEILTLISVFVLGLIVGVIGTVKVIQSKVSEFKKAGPEGVAKFVGGRLSKQLDLDEDQKKEVERVVVESQEKLKALRVQAMPEVREIVKDGEAQIMDVLNPDQAEKFQKLINERKTAWSHFEKL